MKRRRLLYVMRILTPLVLLCAPTICSGQAAITILKLEPTALFPNTRPLHQLALLQVLNSTGASIRCRVQVHLAGSAPELGPVSKIAAGYSTLRVPIPDINSPQELRLDIWPEQSGAAQGGQALATITQNWTPQRKWKVYIVKSSHEDMGYEDFIFKKQHEIANYVDLASRLSDPHQAMGGGDYHYTLETMLFMRNYMEERSESQWRDLVEQHIKTGQMQLMGAPSGVHTHWMDYEELARMAYPGRREAFDRFGLDLKTFMIVDNPSLSWSGAEVLADAGFRYVARWGQGWRTGGNNDYEHTHLPALFWWLAPDGVHKVLFGWRSHYGLSFWYGQGAGGYGNLQDLASEHLSEELKQIEDGSLLGPYPYDAVIYPSYVDHGIPSVDERVLPAWSKAYAYPEIHIGSPTDFFAYVEEKYGSVLPTLSGDLNNFSADYATIDPESQGQKRQASRALPFAEGLSALDSYLDPSYQPTGARAAAIWNQIFDYDEHSWPTQPKATDLQLFNAAWIKKQGAERALHNAGQLLDAGMNSLAAHIRSDGERIVVFNSLAHERDDTVTFAGSCSSVEDLSTAELEPCQQTGANESIFIARAVPAYGYKVYRLSAQAPVAGKGISATADTISNQFYSIRFDSKTGNVLSIVDKKTSRELVDAKAKYQFNQMVYVHKDTSLSKEGFEYSPAQARLVKSSKGPVSVAFDSWTDDPKTGAAIRQTVTLYDGLPRIDIVDSLEHARAMFSNSYEDRYRENIFYAFPVDVPQGQPRVEYPGGVVRPYVDQLRWGSHDYLSANRWVDVSNRDFGVTLAPWNEATVEFGEIRYNQLSIDYKPVKPYLFSYAWSNRMAGLLTLNGNDCNATFRYSLRGHAGDWNSGETSQFGWSIASPLLAIVTAPHPQGVLDAKEGSFLTVDAPNVQITVLKQSERPGNGWIVRLVETAGKPTDVALKSDLLPLIDAYEDDLAENDVSKLPLSGRTIKARILPFGYLTLRLANGSPPPQVENLSVTAQSGEKTLLQWTSTGATSRYEVFRSEDSRDPATEYTLVKTTSEPQFRDHGLDPGTSYYYQVSAVTPDNTAGPPSSQIKVTTQSSTTEPPAPVQDLSVVRMSPTRLMICWRKSPEKNAARYYVYRGDHAGFDPKGMPPLTVLAKSGYFLETFVDRDLQPGHQYFYQVFPENWSGLRGQESTVASATTPGDDTK
jgi:alpha-mannosidase